MLDDQLLRLIDTTSDVLELDNSVIEKDYYVTRIIHALSNVENEFFRLVFAGGTCLAKGHKLVKRMSEDTDFKIQIKNTDEKFSKTRLLNELKKFRTDILSLINISDLAVANSVSRNEGRYMQVELNYPSSFPINTTLRPHLLLEFTLSDVRLPTENLFVKTLIEDTLEIPALFEPTSISCVSVTETAIEKWVGLTRRVIAIERGYHPDDDTLIRHVYDLNAIQNADMITDDFFILAKNIISNDANQFKNQHPEYANSPSAEIQQSLKILKSKSLWKTRYEDFLEAMVYNENQLQNYEDSILVLEKMSKDIINLI